MRVKLVRRIYWLVACSELFIDQFVKLFVVKVFHNLFAMHSLWGGAHRAQGEAECSMKLHPTCALERITMVQFFIAFSILTCIVLVTVLTCHGLMVMQWLTIVQLTLYTL